MDKTTSKVEALYHRPNYINRLSEALYPTILLHTPGGRKFKARLGHREIWMKSMAAADQVQMALDQHY